MQNIYAKNVITTSNNYEDIALTHSTQLISDINC